MEKCWCGNTKLHEYSDDYYVCTNCNTLVSKSTFETSIYHVNDEKLDLYGENYWQKVMVKEAGVSSIEDIVDLYLQGRAIYWLKYIFKYIPLKGSVAEIGCGLGQMAYLMKMLGFAQTAFELSPAICKFIKEKLDVNVVCGDFAESEEQYDAILAFDLFEHILQPEEFLQGCARHLREGGVICFQTPCYDEKLSYEEMCQKKPRFKNLLVKDQHIYLYSRDSITAILQNHGFKQIIFEPAFFGDDYDMFFFASKSSIQQNSKEAIENFLNSANNGRLVKAMIALFDRNQELTQKYEIADRDRNDRLEQNKQLEQILKQSQSDDSQRQVQIEKLTEMLKESEADRAARLEQINKLTEMLQEKKTDK